MFVDRPVGIDLGTTNSEVALLDPSERDLIVYADRFGRRTIPSAVCWEPRKEKILVGRAARNRRGREPGPIESIKRKMGRDEQVQVGPHAMSPDEVSAKILEELRARMAEHLASKAEEGVEVRVGRAVITVPAYFDAPQVEATRHAGELAGLEVLGILQEPTAAAIYHTWKRKLGDGCFLIYDLGGGTFDVSILRCLAGEYQVLAIDGDNYLGGDDFDRRFAERLRRELVERGYALDLDLQNDPEDRLRFLRLVHLAQGIKESLSTADVVPVHEQNVLEDKEGEAVDYEGEVGREQYEEAIDDLVEATLASCRRALAQSEEAAGVGLADIDYVVLVGGSTRVPYVVRRVTEELCARSRSEAPLQDEVDTCVALGAAVHAAQLGGLRIGDDEAQVCVRSPLVGQGSSLRLTVDVERAPEQTAALAIRVDDHTAQASLDQVPASGLRLEVGLGEEPETRAALELRGADGSVRAELPLALYRGDVRPRASSLSQPSVVAKDIALEVMRAGRRDRSVLLAKGTGLPAEARHTFFTGDRSGAVVLRLLQNRLPIKTLMVAVDEQTPVGTPVELTLRCDEAMRLEAKAVVAGQELWAKIEPARQRTPNADEVEALLARAEEAGKHLWGHESHYYRGELEFLVTGIREVVGTDLDKLSALCAKLEHLLESFEGSEDGLSPPMHRFEGLLDRLRRIVFRAEGTLLGMDTPAWEERIDELLQRGLAAWQDSDAGGWRRVYNEAQALVETASEQEFSRRRLDDPEYLAQRLVAVMTVARRLENDLMDFVPSSTEEVRAMQLAERDRLLEALRDKVNRPLEAARSQEPGDAADVRRQVDQASSELNRIDAALEKLPSLGLVTERGRGGG